VESHLVSSSDEFGRSRLRDPGGVPIATTQSAHLPGSLVSASWDWLSCGARRKEGQREAKWAIRGFFYLIE
jgi:hypothetical protein